MTLDGISACTLDFACEQHKCLVLSVAWAGFHLFFLFRAFSWPLNLDTLNGTMMYTFMQDRFCLCWVILEWHIFRTRTVHKPMFIQSHRLSSPPARSNAFGRSTRQLGKWNLQLHEMRNAWSSYQKTFRLNTQNHKSIKESDKPLPPVTPMMSHINCERLSYQIHEGQQGTRYIIITFHVHNCTWCSQLWVWKKYSAMFPLTPRPAHSVGKRLRGTSLCCKQAKEHL